MSIPPPFAEESQESRVEPATAGRQRQPFTGRQKVLAAVALVVALAVGYGVGSIGKSPTSEVAAARAELSSLQGNFEANKQAYDRLASQGEQIAQREKGNQARTAELDKRESMIKGAESAKAASQIREGTWTVGRDIEPGTYVATIDGQRCYWMIARTGSNGGDIIRNDNVQGGRPTVILTVGQDFTSNRCGVWDKQ